MTVGTRSVLRPMSLRQASASSLDGSRKIMLAVGVSAAMLGGPALAQTAPAETTGEGEVTLDTLSVKERASDTNPYTEEGAPYKAKVSGDKRRRKPIAETPATITVITETQLKDSGDTDLRDIVDAQPGVTVGTGENGNAFGDRYIIRGEEARSDVFVDGLRDPGMTIRESFAVEQVEIAKGPSSSFAGRGTTGGAINAVTKMATTDYSFYDAEIGVGTDDFHRLTADANFAFSDKFATRLNLLNAYEDVPDREPADRQRKGLALSSLFVPTDSMGLLFDFYWLQADDRPDLGTYIVPDGGDPVEDLPAYLQSQDFIESDVTTFTFRFGYDFTDNFRIENAVRYGTSDNGYVATGARGTTRGVNDPFAGADTVTLSSHQGWQEVEYFVNQFNAYWDVETGPLKHSFVLGTEYSEHGVKNGIYRLASQNAANCYTGTSATPNAYCITDGAGNYLDDIGSLLGRTIKKGPWDSDYQVDTIGLYVMDTVDVTDWLTVFAGLRYDSFDYSNTLQNTTTFVQTAHEYSDTLWNGHLGVVVDVAPNGNVYASYGSAMNINGGESDLGGNCGYGGVCVVNGVTGVGDGDPEDSESYEIGTKWNLFNNKLLVTAAWFQLTKDNVFEQNDATGYSTLGTLNTGKHRVQGVEIGFVGNLTEKLSGQFGLALMDSEVLESNNAANEGRKLSNFAEESATLQLRYEPADRIAFGGRLTYQSEMYAGQPDSAAGYNTTINDYSYTVPDYTVLDLFATFDLNDNFGLRLNVGNVTDEEYYLAAYRSGSFTYIGDGRNVRLTLAAEF